MPRSATTLSPSMSLHPIITGHLPALRRLAASLDVKSIALVGSAVGDQFDPARSDIDLLVDFGPYSDDLGRRAIRFYQEVQVLFGRRVDVISIHGIRNPTWRQIHAERQVPLYAAA